MDKTITFDSGELLTSADVAAEIELWIEGQSISDNAAQTIASYFMTPSQGDVFSTIAHGKPFDPEYARFEISFMVRIQRDITNGDRVLLLALDALIARTMAVVLRAEVTP